MAYQARSPTEGLSYHDISDILDNYLSHGQLQSPSPPEAPFAGGGAGRPDVLDTFAPPDVHTPWLDDPYAPGQVKAIF